MSLKQRMNEQIRCLPWRCECVRFHALFRETGTTVTDAFASERRADHAICSPRSRLRIGAYFFTFNIIILFYLPPDSWR